MKTNFTFFNLRKAKKQALILFFVVLSSFAANAQLGVYSFTGVGACPNQNPSVTGQPANAVFSNYNNSGVNLACVAATNAYEYRHWNTSGSIDLTEYNEFSITPNAGYNLT